MIEGIAGLALPPASFGVVVAGVLTLIVFGYLIGDNPTFRVAENLLVGTALGFAVVVAYQQILLARLVVPISQAPQTNWLLVVPAAFGLLLFARAARRTGWLTNWTIAPIVGVGAALALIGALVGSLLPQIDATVVPVPATTQGTQGLADLIGRVVLVAGVVSVLCYFYFVQRSRGLTGTAASGAGAIGKWVMLCAFGALFASIATGRVSLLVGRVYFLLGDWLGLIGR